MKKTIEFLQSVRFIFLTLVFVLMAQIIHTMYLFETIRVFDMSFTVDNTVVYAPNWVHSFIFSVAIEFAILMFILNGKRTPSKIYAIGSFATNILYYQSWEKPLPFILSSVLISAMLSGSIWFFSDLFAEKVDAAEKKDNQDRALHENGNGEITRIGIRTTVPRMTVNE